MGERFPRGGTVFPLSMAGLAVAGAFGGYWWLGAPGYPDLPMADRLARAEAMLAARPAQADYVATLPPEAEAVPEDPEAADLLTRLRAAVAARPGDRQGLGFLVREELALGNMRRAAEAQAGLVAAMGAEAGAEDQARLAWLLVSAAGGYVSPEAGRAAEAALALDPENGLARFVLGAMYQQNLRPDLGFRLWRDLLEDSPEDAPWVPIIRERIGALAGAAGVDYTAPSAASGPSAADAGAMAALSPEEREAAIRGMVEGLAARLANEGGPAADWAQLVRALGVLGETERAAAIWAEAQDVFAASPSELEAIAAAAREAGVLP